MKNLRENDNYVIMATSTLSPFDKRKNTILKIEGQTSGLTPKTPAIGQARRKVFKAE